MVNFNRQCLRHIKHKLNYKFFIVAVHDTSLRHFVVTNGFQNGNWEVLTLCPWLEMDFLRNYKSVLIVVWFQMLPRIWPIWSTKNKCIFIPYFAGRLGHLKGGWNSVDLPQSCQCTVVGILHAGTIDSIIATCFKSILLPSIGPGLI
jgi:hypothetical protein